MIRRLRAAALSRRLVEHSDFYERDWSPAAIAQWQLDRFNTEWSGIVREVPHFRDMRPALPKQFDSWEQFRTVVQSIDRKTLKADVERLKNRAVAVRGWRTTGGSTAEPLKIPVGRLESRMAAADAWYARGWFGAYPSDKAFLLWGHSHALASGIKGWMAAARRAMIDRALGYLRWSAYDLSDERMRAAGDALLWFRPAYVVGYSVALDRFARANRDRTSAFRALGLKVAVATAESFPSVESQGMLADVLGCPVAMEYGTVETGLIAHQGPEGGYRAFWCHYMLEVEESRQGMPGYELLVTSLYRRRVPLIRYRVGDLVELEAREWPVSHIRRVVGRSNDYVVLPSGSVIHSEAFTHVVKDLAEIKSYQVVQEGDGRITFKYVADRELGQGESAEIGRRLRRVNAELGAVDLRKVAAVDQTIAGKTRFVVRASR
jgi:phenylacetate-CoA ligase